MSYFVTGATGFIGGRLVAKLLARKGTIHCLVRKGSLGKFDDLVERLGVGKDRLVPIVGDLSKPNLGIAPDKAKALGGKITHVFHLAALYDITADARTSPGSIGTRSV